MPRSNLHSPLHHERLFLDLVIINYELFVYLYYNE